LNITTRCRKCGFISIVSEVLPGLYFKYIRNGFGNLIENFKMNNLFRGLLAGYGAKKLGGGCLSTILIFVLLWIILGQCN
jgi:hypothetical protein